MARQGDEKKNERHGAGSMTITRHISLDDDFIEKMKPYIEKHNGNFGAALKEMISLAGKYNQRSNSSAIDMYLFNWTLMEMEGILIPNEILDEIINPALIRSMGELEENLKRRFDELKWDIDISLKYDRDSSPSDIILEIKGSSQKIKFAASMISQYLVKNSLLQAPLEIKKVRKVNECIRIELLRSDIKDAQKSLYTFFGQRDEVMKIIKSRTAFWKSLVERHLTNNYNMVTVHRNYFEEILANKIPLGEITIENMAKKPIHEIPLDEMLRLIKEVYETSRIAERVDIDKDTLTLYHNFRANEAIEKLKKSLIMLLEANGHFYEGKSISNMIVLKNRPDVEMKINEIVNNLKMSTSTIDQELFMFMTFIKGFKEIPEIPISLTTLGRRIGKSLMQEYESEKSVTNWDLETFQNALKIIDSRLHRESEWKIEGKNMFYTIKKCRLAKDDNAFDLNVCHTARETFKGALNYAFGNKAELNVTKLLTHGDNSCEVMIRLL